MSTPRYLAPLIAALVGISAPLLIAGSTESATPTTGTAAISTTKATAGEKLTFSGRVSGGSRPVHTYRVYSGKLVTKVAGTPRQRHLLAHPSHERDAAGVLQGGRTGHPHLRGLDIGQVHRPEPDAGRGLDPERHHFHRPNHPQHREPRRFQRGHRNAGAGRAVVLQRQDAERTWTTVTGQAGTTNSNGAVSFTVPDANGAYRALAGQTTDGVSAFPSFSVRTTPPPALNQVNVHDPAGATLNPMPNSGNGAAAKYNWWPANGFWDTALGEGMGGPAGQGCTGSNCTPWSDYATGTGRVAIIDGQIALDTGYPDRRLPVWGDLSSTLSPSRATPTAAGRCASITTRWCPATRPTPPG